MSRSYKKHPYTKDGGPTRVRFAKREANKKVRRTGDIPNGKSYRRVFEPWDIHSIMFGGIPKKEASLLRDYWDALPGLVDTIFTEISSDYVQFSCHLERGKT